MIQHIVLFRLKQVLRDEEKNALITDLIQKFEELPSKIPCLRAMSLRRNINPKETFDLVLQAKVETKDDLQEYLNHPAHIALVDSVLLPNIEQRVGIDVWNSLEIKK